MNSKNYYSNLITDLGSLINQGRRTAVRYINSTLVITYWLIGKRIIEYEQKGLERAEYGEATLRKISIDLTNKFGKGFSFPQLKNVRQFYLAYPKKGYTVSSQLGKLVAIDLKIGEFSHADAGQMNLYLNYLKAREKLPGENDPVGIILCSERKKTVVEFALGGMNNKIFASKYKLKLPDLKVLQTEIEHEKQKLLEMKPDNGNN